MSFGELNHASQGSFGLRSQPRQRRSDEESPFERSIRSNVQEVQELVRRVDTVIEQAQRGCLSKRAAESLDKMLERGQELVQDTERIFRDWTVTMAGEPSERHRKKFSQDKLRKAFQDETAHLRESGRRATVARQEAKVLHVTQAPPGSLQECKNVVDDQDISTCGLLADEESESCERQQQVAQEQAEMRHRNTLAAEREEGMKRIQNQVADVHQMFQDLASIVTDQGQVIESIEAQAEAAASNTKQATRELRKTVERQRSARERLCCMLMAAVLLLCFVMLPHMRSLHPYLFGRELASELRPVLSPAVGSSRVVKATGGIVVADVPLTLREAPQPQALSRSSPMSSSSSSSPSLRIPPQRALSKPSSSYGPRVPTPPPGRFTAASAVVAKFAASNKAAAHFDGAADARVVVGDTGPVQVLRDRLHISA